MTAVINLDAAIVQHQLAASRGDIADQWHRTAWERYILLWRTFLLIASPSKSKVGRLAVLTQTAERPSVCLPLSFYSNTRQLRTNRRPSHRHSFSFHTISPDPFPSSDFGPTTVNSRSRDGATLARSRPFEPVHPLFSQL
jgi:hypothetical protein